MIKRLKSPVPNLIKKVQKICMIVGGLSTVITGIMAQFPDMHISPWIFKIIAGATVANHLLLQMTEKKDFIDGQDNVGQDQTAPPKTQG